MKLVSVTKNKVTYYHLFTEELSEITGAVSINLGASGTTIEISPHHLELYHTNNLEEWLKTQKLEQI